MFGVSGAAVPSSLVRNGVIAGRIEGYSCPICGKWIEDVRIEKPDIPAVSTSMQRESYPTIHRTEASLELRRKVGEHVEFISNMRASKCTWADITQSLNDQKKVQISRSALWSYYHAVVQPNRESISRKRQGASTW
jgi:hypothetical protein